jgi:ribonuclease D
MITERESLLMAADRLGKETILAFDLEADSMHHYREQVCLLQISSGSENLIVDPLACSDISPLAPLLADPSITKVFHGADYDVRMLHRCFGIEINNLFDTMIACQFLGEPAVGLAAVLKKRFGVELDKKYQQADWSRRPLPAEMLDYAAKDTSLLIPLYRQLTVELAAKGRLAWVEEECTLLSRVRMAERSDEPLSLRFKGAARLKVESLALLEELLRFRDEEAQRRDLPPFKIMGNETLRELAERFPTSAAEFAGITGLSPKLQERYGRGILQAVRRARELSPQSLPVFPRHKRPERSRQQEARLKKLKDWRGRKAEELGIDPGIMVNNALLDVLAENAPRSLDEVSGIKGWQMEVFGGELLSLVQG